MAIEVTSPSDGGRRIIYRGPDRATVLSGMSDGARIYRAGEIGADGEILAWSEPVTVEVAHHRLSRALGFFAVGAVVFFSTLALIVHGARSRA